MATPSLGAGQPAAVAANGHVALYPPATSPPLGQQDSQEMVLELADGSAYRGISFGAEGKSISGECVFQTGKSRPTPAFLAPQTLSRLKVVCSRRARLI